MTKIISPFLIAVIALAIALNFIGAQLALLLRLPIYLDTVGTILISILIGPWWGILTALLSALISSGSDLFALYYMPVAAVLALLAGLFITPQQTIKSCWWPALKISLPATLVSALITLIITNGTGATSSGSSLLVQILYGLGLSRGLGIVLVQFLTDYADRLLSLVLCLLIGDRLPDYIKDKLKSR